MYDRSSADSAAGEASLDDKIQKVLNAVHSFLKKNQPRVTKALSHVAITDGKGVAYLVALLRDETSSQIESEAVAVGIQLWKIPVPKLPKDKALFPIGAGDTVSAGTLASLMYLKNQREGSSSADFMKERICTSLNSMAPCYDSSLGGEVACAFSFGLACASASCLQAENSVLSVEDALNLFSNMSKPLLLADEVLIIPNDSI